MEVSHESTTRSSGTTDDSLRIYLSRPSDPGLCSFWVSVFKKGTGDSKSLMAQGSLDSVFDYLQNTGLKDQQPLMLSDNTGSEHRHFFLVPETFLTENPDQGLKLILRTVESLGQKRCGLYLSPESLSLGRSQEMLAQLIAALAKTKTSEIYLLAGKIGVNQLLNTSMYVKEKLKDSRTIWIFH